MKMTFEQNDNNISILWDNTNEYEPYSEKERRITLYALKKEQNRIAGMLMRDIDTEHKESLHSDINAVYELIDIYECGRAFAVTQEYKRLLLSALNHEKKHRKAAKKISADIQLVPLFCWLEINGPSLFGDSI